MTLLLVVSFLRNDCFYWCNEIIDSMLCFEKFLWF